MSDRRVVATQTVILAGGRGTRLGDLTDTTPKPLLPVGGKPFLEYLVWNLRRHGIRRIVFSVGYLADAIESAFGDGERLDVSISYSRETTPAGTGGALWLAREQLDEWFYVLNGDTFFDANYLKLPRLQPSPPRGMALTLRHVEDTSRYGAVVLSGDRVERFAEKQATGPGWINGGIYLMNRTLLERLSKLPCSLENDLIPQLAAEGEVLATRSNGFFIDIGTPEQYAASQTLVPEALRRPVAFLDRDGVLNHDDNYVHRPDQFRWIDGAREAVRDLKDLGYYVIIVTNQAGIGHGYYDETQFRSLMDHVQRELMAVGGSFDDVYFCPCHPNAVRDEYRCESFDRKPNPGMLLRALDKWPIDQSRSFMIGDRETDAEAARQAGVRFHMFSGGNLQEFVRQVTAGSHGQSTVGSARDQQAPVVNVR
ncbi:MAG TPA: HAD-IIIA family hydrolase [Caulifigura sp.]|nr:HAD-IIIA family hydrolase [Caulifigura sp.]